MRAIYKRELQSYFDSMIGYIFCAFMIAFVGIYFMVYNIQSGYPYFGYALASASSVLMLAMPILTMRSFAEDRKNKTDQMLLTAPVSLSSIVLGKYLAMVTVFLFPCIILFLCPLIIKVNGTAYIGADYASILMFILYGCMYIAIGMFISSLTESQIIAAVGTFAACFFIIMWNSLISYIPATKAATIVGFLILLVAFAVIVHALYGNVIITGVLSLVMGAVILITLLTHSDSMSDLLSTTLSRLNFTEPLYNTAFYYIFDIDGALFYLSVIAVFIVLTIQILNKRRWN